MCRECGYVAKCKNCNISLTYHIKEEKLNQILKDNVKGYNSWSSWKNKKVYQLDKNENIIRLFDSIASA